MYSNSSGFPLGILGLHIGDTIEAVYEAVGFPKPFWKSAFQQEMIDIVYTHRSESDDMYIPAGVNLNAGYTNSDHWLSLYCYEGNPLRSIGFGFDNGILTVVSYWNNSLLLQQ